MSKIVTKILYFFTFLIVVHLVYVHPFYCLAYFFAGTGFLNIWSIPSTILIAALVAFFFKTDTTIWPLKQFVYWGLGVGFIGLWIFSLGLLVSTMSNLDSQLIGLTCIGLLIVVSAYGVYNGSRVVLREFEITSKKVGQEVLLAFLSDTHLGSNSEKHLRKIKKMLMDVDFDFLIIGGDFIDSGSYDLETLNTFRDLDKPILYITGNHEYYINNYRPILRRLSEFGIKVLDNISFAYANINIIGVDDDQSLKSQREVIRKCRKVEKFNIAVVHKPFLWGREFADVDLMLTGHTHNGQIFPFNLLVRLQSKFIYGLYEGFNSWLYVSCGSGCWGPKIRLGSRNEIVLGRILPALKEEVNI